MLLVHMCFLLVQTQKHVREVYFSGQPLLSLSLYFKRNETQHWQSFKLFKLSHGLAALLSCCFPWSIKLPKQREEDAYLWLAVATKAHWESWLQQAEGGRHLLGWKRSYRAFHWHNIPSWAPRDDTTSYLALLCHVIASCSKTRAEGESMYQVLEGKTLREKCRRKACYYKARAWRMTVILKRDLTMLNISKLQKCIVG